MNKGSYWRKWDLHLHTPQTKLSDNFKEDNDVWAMYSQKLEESDVSVFGITDYFCCDNYFVFFEKFKELYPNSEKKFFPNIEFRLEVSVNKKAEEINIHVIFSNTVPKRKIDDFLTKLNTNITNRSVSLTCKDLNSTSDFERAGISYTTLRQKLHEVFGDEKCYLLIAAANNAGLRPDTNSPRKLNITDEIDKICDGFFGGNQNVEYYLDPKRYENDDLAKPKPVISGCDAHSFEDLDDFLGKRVTKPHDGHEVVIRDIMWIKAEPTFEGLLQIFNEPSRVFFGEMPAVLQRIKTNPTKFINGIKISKADGSRIDDRWFENLKVPLNPELVAIIGNKGKGKSALADIIGLSGNAHVAEDDFSFLHKKKFKNPRPNLARDFVSSIYWIGGGPDSINLDEQPNFDSPERVKYIPQSFLEKLCNSIDKRIFESELEKVIFSRLEEHKKLGKASLEEVLFDRKRSVSDTIADVKKELSSINSTIIELERRNSEAFRKTLTESLEAKRNELVVHDSGRPVKIDPPNTTESDRAKTVEINGKINGFRETIKELELQIATIQSERNRVSLDINELNQAIQTLRSLSSYISSIIHNLTSVLEKYSIEPSKVVNYSVNEAALEELLKAKTKREAEIEHYLSATNDSSPIKSIASIEAQISLSQAELEGENKLYQQYLTQETEWLKKRNEIVGAWDKEGTIGYFENYLRYIAETLHNELNEAYQRRKEALRRLLNAKVAIADLYRDLYYPVTQFIESNKNELSDYNVNIDVALAIVGFEEKFFSYVSNGVAGSFYGSVEGRQVLSKLTDVINFDVISEVQDWMDQIVEHLRYDKREIAGTPMRKELKAQLKGAYSEQDFYDFLFSMDYFEPNYQLKLGDKTLNELSPGERGALLLIFYLLLDKQDIPIIIDQPEENLDNQSVYKILVHFIKKAKERRQIIIVTHNPNLAVVCDAEQIIRMDIAKEDRNLVSMISGGIENPSINRAIVDILEGTRPAFDNRTGKYSLTSS